MCEHEEKLIDTLVVGGHLLTMAGDGVGFVENRAVASYDAGSSPSDREMWLNRQGLPERPSTNMVAR